MLYGTICGNWKPIGINSNEKGLSPSPSFYTEPDIDKWKDCEMPFMSSKCAIINHFTEGYPILYLNTYMGNSPKSVPIRTAKMAGKSVYM